MKSGASHDIFIWRRLGFRTICCRSAHLRLLKLSIFVLVFLSLSCGGGDDDRSGPDNPQGPTQPTPPNGPPGPSNSKPSPTIVGSYQLQVRGYYTGSGTATASLTSLQLNANIHDDSGNTGQFSATLPLSNNRFYGSGSAMGQAIILNGHIDPADAVVNNKSVLFAGRINGTMSIPGNHYGRVAGQYTSTSSGLTGN